VPEKKRTKGVVRLRFFVGQARYCGRSIYSPVICSAPVPHYVIYYIYYSNNVKHHLYHKCFIPYSQKYFSNEFFINYLYEKLKIMLSFLSKKFAESVAAAFMPKQLAPSD
jgi:hypothetical protein